MLVATGIAVGCSNEPEDQFASAQRLSMQDQVGRYASARVEKYRLFRCSATVQHCTPDMKH